MQAFANPNGNRSPFTQMHPLYGFAQGKLLGLDNNLSGGVLPHSKTRARSAELTGTFCTAAAFCRFFSSKSEERDP